MIDSIIKDRCTGCEGCASVCPTKCIDMVQNYEAFLCLKLIQINVLIVKCALIYARLLIMTKIIGILWTKKLRMPLNQIMMNLEEYALQELYFYLLQLILLNTMALYMVLHLMEAIMLFINRLPQQVK